MSIKIIPLNIKINRVIDNAHDLIQKYEQFKRNSCPNFSSDERQAVFDLIMAFESELTEQILGKIQSSIAHFWRTALKHYFPTLPYLYCAQLALNKHILRTRHELVAEHPGLPERIQDMLDIADDACWKVLRCPMTFQLGTTETLLKWSGDISLSEYKALVRQKLSYAKNKSVPNEELWNVIADGLFDIKNGKYKIF
jgi:hypothetical protein